MQFPDIATLTREEFEKQVWVEMSDLYQGYLVFQNINPYFLFNHEPLRFFGDGGLLLNTYKAYEAKSILEQEGFQVFLSDEVEAYLDYMTDSTFELTPSIKPGLKLFKFQAQAQRALGDKPAFLFNHSTGTGKTVSGIVAATRRLDAGQVDHVIVWVKRSLGKQWTTRFEQFTTLDAERIQGTPARRKKKYEKSTSKVWVLNYEQAKGADHEVIKQTLKGKRVMFVYDEVQKLKNRKSALHKDMVKLIKGVNCVFQLALSATPMEKSPEDYYNLFRILCPTIFKRVEDFEREFTYMNGAKDVHWNYLGFQNIQKMRYRTGFMVHSADKKDPEIAKEFPEKQEVIINLELSSEDRKIYDSIMEWADENFDPSDNDPTIGYRIVDAQRRCCNIPESLLLTDCPGLTEKFATMKGIDSSKSSKLEVTKELIEEILSQDEKVIVFFSLTNHGLLLLEPHLKAFNPLLYHGQTPNPEEVIETFQTSPSHNLLLCSDAGREGLNLPQAGYVIHYNTPFLWTHYEQRSDRVHRIDSQRDKVTIYRFLTENTIEARIEENMAERKEFSAQLGLGGEFEDDAEVIRSSDLAYWIWGGR